jgi:hypothetical protein
MNVKQIIKDNDIKEVYSCAHGGDIETCSIFYESLDLTGSIYIGGECLIFPSKEERNWDRFKPKEPTYKPCESVEQFADLFLLKTAKSKTEKEIRVITYIDESYLNYWFNNYTLLDGTPIGIKCND